MKLAVEPPYPYGHIISPVQTCTKARQEAPQSLVFGVLMAAKIGFILAGLATHQKPDQQAQDKADNQSKRNLVHWSDVMIKDSNAIF